MFQSAVYALVTKPGAERRYHPHSVTVADSNSAAADASRAGRWWASDWPVLIACVACTLWCFAPTLSYSFVRWDDPLHVTHNPLLVNPGGASLREHLLTPHLGYPSPLTVLSYRAEAWLFGIADPAPYHATNWLLFGLLVALAFLLMRRIGLSKWASAAAVTLFSLHVVSVEAVSWVSGRKDLLAAGFSLGALLSALSTERRPAAAGLGQGLSTHWHSHRQMLALLLFICALACKPVAAWVALVLPTWRLLGLGEAQPLPTWKDRIRSATVEALPYVALVLLVVPIAWLGQQDVASVRTELPFTQLLRDAWYALGFHLRLLLGLQAPAARHIPLAWPAPFTPAVDLLPLAVAALVALATWQCPKPQRRTALAGLSLALLAYLPTSNLLPLSRAFASVYVFLPLLGMCIWLAAWVDAALVRVASLWLRALPALATAALLFFPARGAAAHWENSVTLWQHAYRMYPHDHRLCKNLGNALLDVEGPRAGQRQYQACAKVFGPERFEKYLGLAAYDLGDRSNAQLLLSRAARRNPSDRLVREYLERLQAEGRGTRR